MQEVIVLQGLPGSGKSTWARHWCERHPTYCRINKDSLRAMLHGGHFSTGNEALILRARDVLITQALLLGWSVIVDDTNLQSYHFQQIQALTAPHGALTKLVTFDVDVAECIRRDAGRPERERVGEVVIRQMAEIWERPTTVGR